MLQQRAGYEPRDQWHETGELLELPPHAQPVARRGRRQQRVSKVAERVLAVTAEDEDRISLRERWPWREGLRERVKELQAELDRPVVAGRRIFVVVRAPLCKRLVRLVAAEEVRRARAGRVLGFGGAHVPP